MRWDKQRRGGFTFEPSEIGKADEEGYLVYNTLFSYTLVVFFPFLNEADNQSLKATTATN